MVEGRRGKEGGGRRWEEEEGGGGMDVRGVSERSSTRSRKEVTRETSELAEAEGFVCQRWLERMIAITSEASLHTTRAIAVHTPERDE